ncbi:MAG: metallophosphoesterase [Desulfobacterales bacterium]|nr:metallophosphoesterase [Desulfobacterales bacterium]
MHPDLKTRETIDIGIISDTHGSLKPKVQSALSRADVIIHAGDFDTPEVLTALGKLAPVVAVRGNMDAGNWAAHLPAADMVKLGGIYLYILHNLLALDLDPGAATVKVVISGHTHQAAAVQSNGVLFLNPGSPTSPRHGTDASVAMLQVNQGRLRYHFIEVE